MGKFGRAAGSSIFKQRREQAESYKETAPERVEEDIQDVETIADSYSAIELPDAVAAKDSKIPTTTAQLEDSLDSVTPSLGMVGRAGEDFDANISDQTLADISKTNIPDIDPETGDVVGNIGLEETRRRAIGDIETQAKLAPKSLEYIGPAVDATLMEDYNIREIGTDENTGIDSFTNMLEAAGKSVDIAEEGLNLFDHKVDLSEMSKEEVEADPNSALRKGSGEILYAIKGKDKLDMLTDPNDINSKIKPDFGKLALMSVILEATDKMAKQAEESDKPIDEQRYQNSMDRISLGSAVGSRIERLAMPSADIDPTKPYTGESSDFGYKYRLTPRERSLVGQYALQAFADSPLFNFMDSVNIPLEDSGSKTVMRTTRGGDEYLYKLRRSLNKNLGIEGYDRPVSNTPPTKEGRLRGEGAFTQKQITASVAPNSLPKDVKKAINNLRQVPHTATPFKLLLAQGMMNASRTNTKSLFAQYMKQSTAYRQKKEKEFLKDYLAQNAANPQFTPDLLGDFNPDPKIGFQEAAIKQADRVMEIHRDMREETIASGANQIDKAFYYGYTAINNSSRLMISNTELNYQMDKLSRFIVDGAIPSRFEKGSNNEVEKGFFAVLARSLVDKADKMSPEGQLLKFEENKARFVNFGNQLLAFTERNKGALAEVRRVVNDPEAIGDPNLLKSSIAALEVSPELEKFLDEQGKDSFYFAMDALHELARYERLNPGDKFVTRVKAEIDGNSNGATIQGYQMGVEELLRKGGVLYSDKRKNLIEQGLTKEEALLIEEDIRDDVFNYMRTAVLDTQKEKGDWENIFDAIVAKNKVKDLMKNPIMTSIYGKDPQFHTEHIKQFIFDNPEIFGNDPKLHEEYIYDMSSQITGQNKRQGYMEISLRRGLGEALEHSAMAKRLGRAFNFANLHGTQEGANGFEIQFGGWDRVDDTSAPTVFSFPSPIKFSKPDQQGNIERRAVGITTKSKVISAAAQATARKTPEGVKTNPGIGSKLRNQFAVNATQNIDATIAQETTNAMLDSNPNRTFMQVYDAFIGDAASFIEMRKIANKKFIDVNEEYDMVQKEIDSLNKLKKRVSNLVAQKIASDSKFDIGSEGEYKSLGQFFFQPGSVINRDMPDNQKRKDAFSAAGKGNLALKRILDREENILINQDDKPKEIKIKPSTFLILFNEALKILQIENDLNEFHSKVKAKRAKFPLRKRGEQYS